MWVAVISSQTSAAPSSWMRELLTLLLQCGNSSCMKQSFVNFITVRRPIGCSTSGTALVCVPRHRDTSPANKPASAWLLSPWSRGPARILLQHALLPRLFSCFLTTLSQRHCSQSLLMDLALASGRSMSKPPVTGSTGHGESFWQLPTESTPVGPCHYQNLTTQIQYKNAFCETKSKLKRIVRTCRIMLPDTGKIIPNSKDNKIIQS